MQSLLVSQSPLIAVPESREQETLSLLLRNRGLQVLEVPLVAILDVVDAAPVHAWLRRFIASPPDLLILLTGEGLRRLVKQAEQIQLLDQFVATLAGVATLCRGPKPEKALRDIGLRHTYSASLHTSAGVLALAQELKPTGKRLGLQLYGEEPNLFLVNGLLAAGALVDVVAPYVYASKEDENRVKAFIAVLAKGEIAMLAFTSQSQYKRLVDVAKKSDLVVELDRGMRQVRLAAVGPIVKYQLEAAGYTVAVMPERLFFMKPFVTAIVRYLQQQREGGVV